MISLQKGHIEMGDIMVELRDLPRNGGGCEHNETNTSAHKA